MSVKCINCAFSMPWVAPIFDVVECAMCKNMTPTGYEPRIRKELEAYKNHLPYPKAAAGRAIGYAAGIYAMATHDTRIDVSGIEATLETKYGQGTRADHTSLKLISSRSALGVTDPRAGLMIFKVSGSKPSVGGRPGQPWTLVYVVFRGSRGDKPSSATGPNPKSAGWGRTATEQEINIDWRSNFNNRQTTPSWSAESRVHAGFLEIYCSMRDTVRRTVQDFLAQNKGAAVITTGHSLGAALATLCAHDLDCSGIAQPFCFPFCSPRVGDLGFVRDFNTKLSNQLGVLWCEADGVSFNRSMVFVQGDDPVSWGGAHGFKHEMSAKSGVQVADRGNIVAKAIYAGLKKHKSDTIIYYHVGNLRRASFFGEHSFEKMKQAVLG